MEEQVDTTEGFGFKLVVLIVSGFFVGFSLANIIYFNRIRRNNGCPGVTRGEATAMLWVNAILFAIALIIFIWSIFRIVATRTYRQRVVQYFREPNEGFIDARETGIAPRFRSSGATTTTVERGRINVPGPDPQYTRVTQTRVGAPPAAVPPPPVAPRPVGLPPGPARPRGFGVGRRPTTVSQTTIQRAP
jgi:hypothetical protein